MVGMVTMITVSIVSLEADRVSWAFEESAQR